ncbi:Na(+) H(+) antiporter subunit E [Castellaniella defragrans 65Phen]|uniref:Na(+) H(+) antiporter subunit E n=2 Tax=Castellaniella defragrans TaxID=75697 RepID=W8X3W6_CASD6|nr:Na+/H+ antiporter subunit E [Castellaniella defragrans]KAB0609994.1 Na+/H+ antiporter subunit E [Castellaniella defragrans]MBB6085507.1 multicomponent K+:H+ antiporter subunit E [Castellaniella defragrans]CDM24016.1 Na(+) H(+) antiporter subunit E [Castellaniella defragrans 65Phen]
MKRLLRALPLACLLLILWLVLNDSLSAGHLILGAVIALALALLAPILRPVRARLSHPLTALRLAGHVAADIARSNRDVGLLILRGPRSGARPGFLDIPLRIRDPHGLATLACIVTFTPGTVWAGHDPDSNVLTLHVLDLSDPQGLTRIIQDRYERPLMEIFE